MTQPNTLFIRLEGPLQAWGNTSKFVIRRCMDAPTKSGVLGMVCCAMGLSRQAARERLPELNRLAMAVRIDRPGTRWWDWHTVGARIGLMTAEGKLKTGAQGTLITRREYLADASFLVALRGDDALVQAVVDALSKPKWPLYLGRKCCPPAVPVFAGAGQTAGLEETLRSEPWRPRYSEDAPRDEHRRRCKTIDLDSLIEWKPRDGEIAPAEAEVWYDKPDFFDPPVHEPRLVLRQRVAVEVGEPLQQHTPPPPRPRANYQDNEYKKRRAARLEADHYLCVFCKAPCDRPYQATVQHVTYRRAGGNEARDDLRSLCRLCHDAVTMIEYGLGMGLDRIDPCEPRWRDDIIAKRDEIIRFRSLDTRRRRLSPEEVE